MTVSFDGLATEPDHSTKPGVPEQCVRGDYRHNPPVHPGFSFCRDCLVWLRAECDDDPLADAPPARQTTPAMWQPYVEMLRGGAGL